MAYSNAIFYIDLVNGNDAARTALTSCIASNPSGSITRITKNSHGLVNGAVVTLSLYTAWLNGDWKIENVTTNTFDLVGAVWQATADADGTVTPFGGSSWTDSWKTVTSGATAARITPGDEIRFAKSPDPISIGNASWTQCPSSGSLEATKNIVSSLLSSPIQMTVTAHGYSNGDVIQVIGHTGNTNANGAWIIQNVATNTFELVGSVGIGTGGGATGTVQRINSRAVVLDAERTLEIDRCHVAWTASAGGDTTVALTALATDAKEGGYCMRFTLDSSPQTSKGQAYRAISIPAATAGQYQFLSLNIKPSAILLATHWKISLCSDAAGGVVVDTFDIPAIPVAAFWTPLKLARNGGGNLGNNGTTAIQSIRVETGTVAPTASSNISINNIILTKTGDINLQSLISKNKVTDGFNENWIPIQSINRRVVLLECYPNSKSNQGQGYSFNTETITTYIRECVQLMFANATTVWHNVTESGSKGLLTSYKGGYNTVSGLQDGYTFMDALNGNGICFSTSTTRSYIAVNRLGAFRFAIGFQLTALWIEATDLFSADNLTNNIALGSKDTIDGVSMFGSGSSSNAPISVNSNQGTIIKNVLIESGNTYGTNLLSAHFCKLENVMSRNCVAQGLATGSSCDVEVLNCTTRFNAGGSLRSDSVFIKLINCDFGETTEMVNSGAPSDQFVRAYNHDKTEGNHWMWTSNATINWQTSVKYGSQVGAWRFTLASNVRVDIYPVPLLIAEALVDANKLVTVKTWVKKDHDTDVGARLITYKQVEKLGLNAAVSTNKANDTNWEELTITFTPTKAGVVQIYLEAWYNTAASYVYVGETTITQAT